jgi:hypothetical protein
MGMGSLIGPIDPKRNSFGPGSILHDDRPPAIGKHPPQKLRIEGDPALFVCCAQKTLGCERS